MDAKAQTIASLLSRLGTEKASAQRIAAFAAETMHAIHLALAPVIGDKGVLALYRRSLFMISRDVPSAASFYREAHESSHYSTLQSAIAEQSASDALCIAEALFANIHAVLVSLIGAALTERLLHPMFDTSPNGNAVQEAPHE